MRKCCFQNIDKAERLGRARYCCPKCRGDVSTLWYMYQICLIDTEKAVRKQYGNYKIKLKKQNGKTSKKTRTGI